MRSVIAVAAGVLLLVSTSLAASSVKLPSGFVAPENAEMGGESLYFTIANSLNTLPRNADLSHIATPSSSVSTLVGFSAVKRAALFVVPEALASSDSVSAVADNAFPLYEMSRILNTALVMSGASPALKEALSSSYRKMRVPRDMMGALDICGISMAKNSDKHSYMFNGAEFDEEEIDVVAGAAATICGEENTEQVTLVDFRPAYDFIVERYGKESAQATAVASAIKSAISMISNEKLVFVLATDSDFFRNQRYPNEDFVAVPPHLGAFVKSVTNKTQTSPDAGMFQITLWFTIFIVIVTITFAVLTCGVGIDIEKDTLLYQTTCLRGQPVL